MVPTPAKHRMFILQHRLNFQDHQILFQDNTAMVNYIFSFLKGSALDCFEPTLFGPEQTFLAVGYELFIEELKTNLRTYDPIGEVGSQTRSTSSNSSS